MGACVQSTDDELSEKVWAMVLAISGRSAMSTSFTCRCRIGVIEGFPAIVHTLVPQQADITTVGPALVRCAES